MSGIIIICNNRAERGPLQSVIDALPEAQVLGLTEMQQRGPVAKVLGWSLWWFDREFAEREPELVVVVGDRYETLGAVQAAYFRHIPVAHIHGGETTAGAFDDAVRDSITRMSVLHFVATEDAYERVCDLGFGRRGVHLTGAPGLDGVPGNSARRDKPFILVTYHPETRKPDYGAATCENMLRALEPYAESHDITFCGVNNDPGCEKIRAMQQAWAAVHPRARVRPTIDHGTYMALMQSAQVVVGNSSAIPIESPWVGVPSVLVGDRQLGREMSNSIFQDDFDVGRAIEQALAWRGPWQPCYRGEAAPRIAKIVREFVGRGAERKIAVDVHAVTNAVS